MRRPLGRRHRPEFGVFHPVSDSSCACPLPYKFISRSREVIPSSYDGSTRGQKYGLRVGVSWRQFKPQADPNVTERTVIETQITGIKLGYECSSSQYHELVAVVQSESFESPSVLASYLWSSLRLSHGVLLNKTGVSGRS